MVPAVRVLEGPVLQPGIRSRTVRMHPAVVMTAITAGAGVAGIPGMPLAVPVTAAAFRVTGESRTRYAASGSGPSGGTSPDAGDS